MTKILFIQKRCERCERLFSIQNIKDSKARDLIIRYTPCSHCFYSEDGLDKSGRCLGCSIPFIFVDHKAKGRCHRCLMAHYRKTSTKTV